MLKHCLIILGQGRGGRFSKRAVLAWMITMLVVLGSIAGDAGAFSVGSGSYDNLKLDSTEDIFNVSQTVSGVVNEVLRDVVPTDFINTPTNIPFNMPLNPIGHVKTISTSLPGGGFNFTEYFSPEGVSTDDLSNMLKGTAVLSIQIFVVVIQVVSGMAKGILEALAN